MGLSGVWSLPVLRDALTSHEGHADLVTLLNNRKVAVDVALVLNASVSWMKSRRRSRPSVSKYCNHHACIWFLLELQTKYFWTRMKTLLSYGATLVLCLEGDVPGRSNVPGFHEDMGTTMKRIEREAADLVGVECILGLREGEATCAVISER